MIKILADTPMDQGSIDRPVEKNRKLEEEDERF